MLATGHSDAKLTLSGEFHMPSSLFQSADLFLVTHGSSANMTAIVMSPPHTEMRSRTCVATVGRTLPEAMLFSVIARSGMLVGRAWVEECLKPL